MKQSENRALRLRGIATNSHYAEETLPSTSVPYESVPPPLRVADTSPRLTWDYFDEAFYIQRGGLSTGEDPYVRNRFNQQASDALPSNRNIPDTRNQM